MINNKVKFDLQELLHFLFNILHLLFDVIFVSLRILTYNVYANTDIRYIGLHLRKSPQG